MPINEAQVIAAYQLLAGRKNEYFEAAEIAIDAETELEEKIAHAIFDGRISGKNDATRDAEARDLFGNLFGRVTNVKASQRVAKINLDLAEIEVSQVMALLRVDEILSRIAPGK